MSDHRRFKYTGLERIVRSVGATGKGARHVFAHEAAFRQELCLAALAILTALVFCDEWLALFAVVSSWILVLMAEVVNTAVETIVDRISLERHPLSGAAKDLGSLAVALSLGNAFVWWVYAVFF